MLRTFLGVILSETKDLKDSERVRVRVHLEILHCVQNDIGEYQHLYVLFVILSETKDLEGCMAVAVRTCLEILHCVQNDIDEYHRSCLPRDSSLRSE